MFLLESIPFLYIAIAFAIGIMTGMWSFLSIVLLIFRRFRKNWVFIVLICGGGALSVIHNRSSDMALETKTPVLMVLDDSVSNYFNARIISTSPNSEILLQKATGIGIGDTISASIYLESINKHDIGIKSIYNSAKLNGINYVAYLYEDDPIEVKQSDSKNNIIEQVRDYVSESISNLSLAESDIGVLKALIIGDRTQLDNSTKRKYRRAGIMHALAVSGMHIGIMFLIMNLLLKFMNLFFVLRIVKICIIILLLSFYAMICGATPSVMRALIMFSIFQISSFTITSRYHAYNILFFSAFILMIVDPNIIWNISFQFSYMAMFSLIYSADKCSNIILTKGKVVDRAIALIGVSISVTIFTLPLTLYYFSEGTVFALLSNIVIAILLPILFVSTWLWVVFELPIFNNIIEGVFETLNYCVGVVSSWDVFYLDRIVFNIEDLILSYISITLIIFVLSSSSKVKKINNKLINKL